LPREAPQRYFLVLHVYFFGGKGVVAYRVLTKQKKASKKVCPNLLLLYVERIFALVEV
jgi:hypothetical protein